MDTKSLARSKRAHSQHHSKKSHPNPKSRTQPTPPSDSNNPLGKQVGAKPRKPHAALSSSSSALPSNWDRYQDEFDDSISQVTTDSTSKPSDVVLPKSKGADFGFLISEAQSQLHSHQGSHNSSRFPSFDDVLPDFDQGICSMLSVRGNGMLSWIGSDSFIVDDDSAINDEVSFLTMDLHSIASKLEKIDASQRLFVEADILSPEADVDRSKETINPESEQADGSASGVANQCLDEIPYLEHCNDKSVFCSSKVMPSTTPGSYSSLTNQLRQATPTTTTSSTSFQPLSSEENSPMKDDSIQIERSFLGEIVDSISALNVNDVDDAEEKSTIFEAAAAEEELDMLLNSFAEVKLPDSFGMSNKPGNNLRVSEWNPTDKLSEGHSSRPPPVQGSKSPASLLIEGGIDDTIDDLLQETFTRKDQKVVTTPHVPTTSANSTVSLDDFDSWLNTL